MKKVFISSTLTALLLLSTSHQVSQAKVSAEQAQQLGNTLSPIGAELAGNVDGTIDRKSVV